MKYNTLYCLFLAIIISGCSSINTYLMYDLENFENLIDIKVNNSEYKGYKTFIYVDISTQLLFFVVKGTAKHIYKISTSVYGTGNKKNTFKTPLGKHIVSKKIGKDLPIGSILIARKWNGSIAKIIKKPIDTDLDLVTTRILWLEGTEQGFNKGPGVDSKSRFIYIHGTPEEGLIGQPASDGCVRMYNKDILELFSLVEEKTPVWIY